MSETFPLVTIVGRDGVFEVLGRHTDTSKTVRVIGTTTLEWCGDTRMTPYESMTTADGVEITHGMRVWDYDLRKGTVDLSTLRDGWFYVNGDNGGRSLMNAERVCVRHPFTKESA
jgi:hypothetical protein